MTIRPARSRGEELRFAPPEVDVEHLSGGGMILRARPAWPGSPLPAIG